MDAQQPRRSPTTVQRGITVLAGLLAVVLLVRLGSAWLVRLPHPYDLEWMEGGMLAHAWRLQQGHALYVRPSPEFTPFIYPPGYPAILAGLGSFTGLSPLLGRLVSIAGTLLAAGALFFATRQQRRGSGPTHGSAFDGGLVAASFLGCAWWGGMFTDLVRPDGLLLGLLGVSCALVLVGSQRLVVLGGGVLAAAFLVKHNAAFYGPALVFAAWLLHGRRTAIGFVAAAALPSLLAVGWLQWRTGGLFLTYLLAVPASHELVGIRAFPGAPLELAQPLFPTLAGAAGLLLMGLRGRGLAPRWAIGVPLVTGVSFAVACATPVDDGAGIPLVPVASFVGLTAIGAVLAGAIAGGIAMGPAGLVGSTDDPRARRTLAILPLVATAFVTAVWMRAHSGGYLNVHLPFFWMAALASGVALGHVRSESGWGRPALHGLFAIQLGVQAGMTPFSELRPTEADVQAGDALVRTLEGVEGPVWSPYAVWLPTYAGHDPMTHQIALMDVAHPEGPLYDDLASLRSAIVQQRLGAILTSQRDVTAALGRDPTGARVPLSDHYRLRTRLHHPAGALRPRTGWRVELTAIWVPK